MLKIIEESEKAKEVVLPDLNPMIETLIDYMQTANLQRHFDEFDLIDKLGDRKSQYYNACYQIARVMLAPESQKRRCVILHGDTDTGKSKIAEYMRAIFKSYYKNETRGIHDEKVTPL